MLARCSVVLLSLWAPAASAQAPLTEEVAIARALERARLDELADAREAAERGAARAESAWPSIELGYTREQTFGPGATGEDYLGLAVPLDLGNRRGLRGEAITHRARAAALSVDELRRARIAEVRRAFHAVAAGRARASALSSWLVGLEAVLGTVRDRVSAGDASRYDSLRLERERATGHVRLDVERARLAGAEAELASLIGAPVGALEARELPDDPRGLAGLLDGSAELPRVRLWDEHEAAGRLDAEAGARGWVPELSLSLGWKGIDQTGGRADGFYAGAVLAIPLFDLGEGARARGEAHARIASIEREAARAGVERDVRSAHAQAVQLLAVARAFVSESEERSGELVRIASASYAGGEAGLLELLDAERGAIEDRLAAIDLALSAWDARIELDRAAGGAP